MLLIQSNSLHIPLADQSVHCVVTSPPYWNLRDYGISEQLGHEPTPEQYIANMVAVFREVRRVLHNDGTLWLNMGDSYAGGGRGRGDKGYAGKKQRTNAGSVFLNPAPVTNGLKPKDLVGIPWALAFALRADGWYLRSDIIWHKPNPMPESVRDRPTKSHEYVFLLSKSERYFYDLDAIREPLAAATLPRAMRGVSMDNKWAEGGPGSTAHTMSQPRPNIKHTNSAYAGGGSSFKNGHSGYYSPDGRLLVNPAGRNKHTVWLIPTRNYSGAHFATFPPALVVPCIKAGTSERGVCSVCGGQWVRVTDHAIIPTRKAAKTFVIDNRDQEADRNDQGSNRQKDGHKPGYVSSNTTIGWRPACSHYPKVDEWQKYPPRRRMSKVEYEQVCAPIRKKRIELLEFWKPFKSVPAIVFDPFVGSGTTLEVAWKLGRRGVGIDLSADYLQLAQKRLEPCRLQLRLF